MNIPLLIAYYSDLVPVSAFLILISKHKELQIWVIFLYSITSFIVNSLLLNSSSDKGYLILSVFTGIEYTFFALILYLILIGKIIKKVFIAISALFILFILFTILFHSKYKFDSVQTSIEAILLIGFCIIFLFEQINQPQISFIYSSYTFWIVVGILIYLAITFFLYVFAASLPFEVAKEYWIINNLASILKNIMFTIAIIIYVKPPKMQNHGDFRPFLN
jgi:hypothetical protein